MVQMKFFFPTQDKNYICQIQEVTTWRVGSVRAEPLYGTISQRNFALGSAIIYHVHVRRNNCPVTKVICKVTLDFPVLMQINLSLLLLNTRCHSKGYGSRGTGHLTQELCNDRGVLDEGESDLLRCSDVLVSKSGRDSLQTEETPWRIIDFRKWREIKSRNSLINLIIIVTRFNYPACWLLAASWISNSHWGIGFYSNWNFISTI